MMVVQTFEQRKTPGDVKLSVLFNSLDLEPGVQMSTKREEYSDTLEFSSDEEDLKPESSGSTNRPSTPTTAILTDKDKDVYNSAISFGDGLDSPFHIEMHTTTPSYFKYKVSEYTIFQKYVYESRETLNLMDNLDLVVSITLMLEGMRTKLRKTPRNQLPQSNLDQLEHYLNHIDQYLEKHTLENSRNTVRIALGISKFLELLSTPELVQFPEIVAVEECVKENSSQLNFLELRGNTSTMFKMLLAIQSTLR